VCIDEISSIVNFAVDDKPKRVFRVILGYLPASESLVRHCGDILEDRGTGLLGSELKREEEREERCGVEVARDSASLELESGGW
jgi:hypothetical protein